MRIIGPCLVILAFCLQGFVTYAFFWHGLEPISLEAGWPASIALSILGVFLLANALYNYTKAILTPGGIPPPYEKEQPELMNITEKQIPARPGAVSNEAWANGGSTIVLVARPASGGVQQVFGFFFYDIIFAFGRRGTRAFRNCVLMSFMQRHPWEMDYRMPPVCLAWSFEQGGQQQIPQRGLALFNLFDGRAQDKMLFLAVVSHEEPPLAVFELLDRIYQVAESRRKPSKKDWGWGSSFKLIWLIANLVLLRYLGEVSEDSLRQNFSTVSLSCNIVWWRRQNVVYGSNEVYVDIVETISCICNSTGNMISGGVNGEVLINSKLSGVPEVLLTMRNPAVLQNVSFHPCVRLPRFQRDKALSFIPPDGEFSLASYWIPDTTLNLPFHFSVSVNYHSDHGKVQIAASPKLAVTMQNKQMLIDKFVVQIRLPSSIASANLASQGGNIRFDDESKVIIWNLGKLASQDSKAEGTLNYATDPKDGTPKIPAEEKPTAQLAFVIKGWAISGIRLDACDVSSINYTPYKASRYTTTAGKIEYRIA
ncbi:AP-3 complex subunit mu-1 (AP-3 adaptor complex mu3A subunit) (Adaptor-related protein complex 3 subunit mu-1) (Mu-adaptin 3A) (Mu3A-adaptin) [Durusdinium trenchii]|uniref:AP-3 complex subunit mu-1 (AP-3 adaptor complex mu3A subunit) (Adaptor-related protein complex 3 subunit mu-1) (Mu-adaptin 3A) (Mu3A-adaptin) n=1 Tax=Durusdinium trenchii TaxID=1381693 RepID=A0ABP0JMK6_9DINO